MTAPGQRAIKRHYTLSFLSTPTAQRHPGLYRIDGPRRLRECLSSAVFFLRSFRHSRAFGLVRRQARAAAGLCVAFSGPLHSDRRLSYPVFARVVLAGNLADLFGKSLVRVASRDRA
jgi:hypothetical protein